MAIDPALSGPTGRASFDLDSGKLIDHGVILGKFIWDWAIRKHYLALAKLLIIEKQGEFCKGKKALEGLTKAVCLWTFPAHDQMGIPVHEVSPNDWLRAYQRGYRKGIKKDLPALKYYIKHRFQAEVNSPDVVAAICLGAYYFDYLRR